MRHTSDKVVDKMRTHIFVQLMLLNRAVYDIIWKTFVEPERPEMAIWSMRIAC